MHPPFVLVAPAHAAPAVALLEHLDGVTAQQLGDLNARDARRVEEWRDGALHDGACEFQGHRSKMSLAATVRTLRSIAISRARTASASICATLAGTPPFTGEVANTTSPSKGVAAGVMRRYSAALAARASAPSAARSSDAFVAMTLSVVLRPASASKVGDVPAPRARNAALSSHSPEAVRAP